MSQFDQTTEKLKLEHHAERPWAFDVDHRYSLERGRNSTKASMEILARAVSKTLNLDDESGYAEFQRLNEAIAQVKANGDWPLEEK